MKRRRLGILLTIAALAFVWKWWTRAPSEEELRTRFTEHRADFERLNTMYQYDASSKSDLYTSLSLINRGKGTKLSASRVEEYRALMKKLGVDGIGGSRERYRMPIFGGGFTDTSWSIGYAYNRSKPEIVVPSAYRWTGRQYKTAFAPLSGHWYIYNSH